MRQTNVVRILII